MVEVIIKSEKKVQSLEGKFVVGVTADNKGHTTFLRGSVNPFLLGECLGDLLKHSYSRMKDVAGQEVATAVIELAKNIFENALAKESNK